MYDILDNVTVFEVLLYSMESAQVKYRRHWDSSILFVNELFHVVPIVKSVRLLRLVQLFNPELLNTNNRRSRAEYINFCRNSH
jgi:hypothetical protein